ncbi:MAG: sigma-70 family RNA polymerase sigma factor [Chloroflexota bacterium]|nr:sigma-70 family RNA polymerase sigma factor [Chloroflexota bacterium]
MTEPRDASYSSEAEFDRLFNQYSAPVYNYILRMVGDADRAADIAQDTFIKAYRKLHTLTDASSARAWIYRIATNTAIDAMRRNRHTVRMDLEDRPVEQPDGGPGPETQVLSGLLDERIGRALLRLKPNHRQCLILSDVEDMSATQIGEVMEMSGGAVRVLLCRARAEMRRLLAAEGLVR